MTTYTALLSRPSQARPSACMVAPVLIQVPELIGRGKFTLRLSAAPRGRRRIRREVRVAATTLLFAVPMSWALLFFVKIGPAPGPTALASPLTVANASDPMEDGPRVTITLDPSAVAGSLEPEVPIALPAGYLVPDEDSAHAGH